MYKHVKSAVSKVSIGNILLVSHNGMPTKGNSAHILMSDEGVKLYNLTLKAKSSSFPVT